MGLLHCPLCICLAVLSALRFSAYAVMAFQLERQRSQSCARADQSMGVLIRL
ncbi:putative conserved secreted protein [Synechococcus sp. BIOS-E4-1]|nr:putative conserved secreted protein [Synechococcus sp. BIOS-E4-1]